MILSPGLILSGLYPHEKSFLYSSDDFFSRIGTQNSSVAPGKTVDSYITRSSFFKIAPIISVAFSRGFRSGIFLSSIGVGTVTIKQLHSFKLSKVEVNETYLASLISVSEHSRVESFPCLRLSILFSFMSKPQHSLFPNSVLRYSYISASAIY